MVSKTLEHLYDPSVERFGEICRFPGVRELWFDGDPWDSKTTMVVVGELPERWYATTSGRTVPWAPAPGCAWAGPDAEHYARAAARRWRRTLGGKWSGA
jgi:hypothetical protein